jgi:hypothetical protein
MEVLDEIFVASGDSASSARFNLIPTSLIPKLV